MAAVPVDGAPGAGPVPEERPLRGGSDDSMHKDAEGGGKAAEAAAVAPDVDLDDLKANLQSMLADADTAIEGAGAWRARKARELEERLAKAAGEAVASPSRETGDRPMSDPLDDSDEEDAAAEAQLAALRAQRERLEARLASSAEGKYDGGGGGGRGGGDAQHMNGARLASSAEGKYDGGGGGGRGGGDAGADDSSASLNAELRRLRAEAYAPMGVARSDLSSLVAEGSATADADLARLRADLVSMRAASSIEASAVEEAVTNNEQMAELAAEMEAMMQLGSELDSHSSDVSRLLAEMDAVGAGLAALDAAHERGGGETLEEKPEA
eukprot:CAMPEP_0203834702 /NCGR_PEP_ID=MMETSP0115-20131106/73292_1 /ASSEMBLY_ACC=CAM_ASM_000227 /TAXON_ID=33651 /ORGANISM="Bicosoecid sp, Strain ms1" /LENGTH=325 /DNA_ID=CAMNT_0050743781 /DNA_START=157 /DNA_END=1134 /DNA_ORIENTATION=+